MEHILIHIAVGVSAALLIRGARLGAVKTKEGFLLAYGKTMKTFSPWRAPRTIPWHAITSVAYSEGLQWHVLATRGFGFVRLHDYLSGKGSLLAELGKRGVVVESLRIR